MAFGGAGPLHAVEVARSLDIREVIVPYAPGILCAQGLIVSDLKEDFVHSARLQLDDAARDSLAKALGELNQRASEWFQHEGVPKAKRTVAAALDMRYVGQNFELSVPVGRPNGTGKPALPALDKLRDSFFDVHNQHYGFHNPDDAIEVVNVRLTASGRSPIP